eukprot:194313-Amphidinium_carterae.2
MVPIDRFRSPSISCVFAVDWVGAVLRISLGELLATFFFGLLKSISVSGGSGMSGLSMQWSGNKSCHKR